MRQQWHSDFGTTYSGYAYSMNNDLNKIFCDHWNSGTSTLISQKTPITVLLDAKQEFLAFGYDNMILYDKARTEVSIFVQ